MLARNFIFFVAFYFLSDLVAFGSEQERTRKSYPCSVFGLEYFFEAHKDLLPFDSTYDLAYFLTNFAKARGISVERTIQNFYNAYSASVYQQLFHGIDIQLKIDGMRTPVKLSGFWVRDAPFFAGATAVPQDKILSSKVFVQNTYKTLPHLRKALEDPKFLAIMDFEEENFFVGSAIIMISDLSGKPLAHVKSYYFDSSGMLENDPLASSLLRDMITPWERHSYFESKPPFRQPFLNPEHAELYKFLEEHRSHDTEELLKLRKTPEKFKQRLDEIANIYRIKVKALQVGEIYRLAKAPDVKIDFSDFWHHLLFAGVVLAMKEQVPTFYMEARTPQHRDVYKFFFDTDDVFEVQSEINPASKSWRIRQTTSKLLEILKKYMRDMPSQFTDQQRGVIKSLEQEITK